MSSTCKLEEGATATIIWTPPNSLKSLRVLNLTIPAPCTGFPMDNSVWNTLQRSFQNIFRSLLQSESSLFCPQISELILWFLLKLIPPPHAFTGSPQVSCSSLIL